MMGDLALLQGTWRQVRFEENGLIDPPDSHGAEGAITTISGTAFHVGAPCGTTLLEGVFTLAAATNPKAIDWIDGIGPDAGKVLPAIYTLSADCFVFAAADAGLPRPKDFAGGPGITIRAFVRA